MRVDFAWMVRTRLAQPGAMRAGTLNWTCGGEPSGSVSYTCDMRDPDHAFLELRYTITRHWSGEQAKQCQRIALSHTVPHYGGQRWWMHCPVKGHRVGKLYLPAGGDQFASRAAWRIGYSSQRIADRDKPFEALFRIQRRLGCPEGWEQFIQRPKGMWRRTFERLEQRYWELDAQCGLEMMALAERLQRM